MSIQIKNLIAKIEDKKILDNISFTFTNKVLAIIGPSGSGKTTFLRCLAGLQPYQGEVIFNQENMDKISVQKRNIGMVTQENSLLPHLSVMQNISYPLQIRKYTKQQIRQMVDNILEIFSIEQLANKLPQAISGGEKQRVNLARALVYQPSLLLLDEPFASLDAVLRFKILKKFKEIFAWQNMPAILVTHDLQEAVFLADQLLFLQDGQNIFFGNFDQLKKTDKPEIRNFLDNSF